MKLNLKTPVALFALLVFISSVTFAGTPYLSADKFSKASSELKKEQSNLNLFKKSPGQKENKLDLKSKASELGLKEDKLASMLNHTNDSLQTDALNSTAFTGQHSQDYFGYSVSKAGDINGDGYNDIIIGSPGNNTVGSSAGRVFIYFGGTSIGTMPDVVLTAQATGDYFGCSVSDAGDLNGDGFGDFIVGAMYADAPANNSGKAYIYFGGNEISNTANLTISGTATNDFLGSSVACAGDVNGDGYSDVLVGAAFGNKAYIFFGGANMNNVADVNLTGEVTGDNFGFSVSGAGDINGDGYSDVIVGAPYYTSGVIGDAGRAYLYYGGASMNNTADVIFTGTVMSNALGYSVSNAGDVNGDGYEDIIIGAPFSSSGQANIYFGGAAPDNTADVVFTGQATNDEFGVSVACAGDVNCDGYSDVIVGSLLNDLAGTNYGAAFVYFGGISIDNIADAVFTGSAAADDFGYSVQSAGDVNGDGINDFLISSPYVSGTMTGKVYLYSNSMTGNDVADLKLWGPTYLGYFGHFVSGAGDLNGDGYGDYCYSNYQGALCIFFGGTALHSTPDLTVNSVLPGYITASVADCAGDVNGDGYDDIIVGNYLANYALIYYGGTSMDTLADVTLSGANQFGVSVAGAGDVNGDGFADVIVGSLGTGTNPNKAYIYFGGRPMNNLPDLILRSYNDLSYPTISSAGDVNKDGYSDIIVGNISANSYTGQVSLYYGGSAMDTTKDVIFSGAATGDQFGYSVGSGDFNNDGYSDILAGANYNNDGGSAAGKVYIYYGSAYIDNTVDVSIPGIPNERLGRNVTDAGDVNNDGFDDILASSNYGGDGRAYVYFGGSYISTTPSITMAATRTGEVLGAVVKSAGDINKDGFSDLIINSANVNTDYGAISIYLSSSTATVPRIMAVKDVANDQGGSVRLKFTRSGYDVTGQNKITGYYIEKSPPPGASGFTWEPVATITPSQNPIYSYTAATWGDSSSNGSDKIYFRVTAKTLNATESWKSNIMYGQSIDNLSPAAPANLAAAPTVTKINLSWTANNESDMKDYLIYRNGVNISSAGSTSFADTTALADSTYIYKIAARDIHGNISPLSTADTASLESITTINITVIPEGLLNTGTNQLRMRDTVKAKLWDLTGSYIVDSATAVIDSVTFLVSFTFKNAPTGEYYIAISHRNSIETWSKTGGESYTHGAVMSYDFTSANTQAYGNNLKLKGGRYCMYSGDVNASGVINSTDRTLIRSNVGQTGYIKYDLDGNGVVNSADRTIVRNNTGIARQRP